jgi:hypothetical protein
LYEWLFTDEQSAWLVAVAERQHPGKAWDELTVAERHFFCFLLWVSDEVEQGTWDDTPLLRELFRAVAAHFFDAADNLVQALENLRQILPPRRDLSPIARPLNEALTERSRESGKPKRAARLDAERTALYLALSLWGRAAAQDLTVLNAPALYEALRKGRDREYQNDLLKTGWRTDADPRADQSLDEPVGDEQEANTLHDVVATPPIQVAEAKARLATERKLRELTGAASVTEYELRAMLARAARTIPHLADELGKSRNAIDQAALRGMRKVKAHLTKT